LADEIPRRWKEQWKARNEMPNKYAPPQQSQDEVRKSVFNNDSRPGTCSNNNSPMKNVEYFDNQDSQEFKDL